MCKSGQFYLNYTWGIPFIYARIGCEKGCFDLEGDDESSWHKNGRHLNMFFNIVMVVSNMPYFNVQQIAIDHKAKEWNIDINLHNDDEVPLEGGMWDATLQN